MAFKKYAFVVGVPVILVSGIVTGLVYLYGASLSGWQFLGVFAGMILLDLLAIGLGYRVAVRLDSHASQEQLNAYASGNYASLFDRVMDGVYRSTHEGKFVDVNAAMVRMFGYSSKEEMLQVDIKKDLYFAPSDRESLFLDTGQEKIEYFLMRRKDGSEIWVEDHGHYVHDDQGNVIFHEGILRDTTERVKAEIEIRRLNEELEKRVLERTAQLEAANKELESFSYSVSHDLRGPLRIINGYTNILVEDFSAQLPPEAMEHLKSIQKSTVRMGKLIDDLLTFSRLNRQLLSKRNVSMNKLVGEVLEELHIDEEGRHLEIRVGKMHSCQADPVLLKQVLANLIANALKFTRKRDPAEIEIGSFRKDGERVYYVRDNGVGFDMKYADKLFGVFQRLHSMKEYEGNGLGLAIVQHIITRHGGRVWAEAEAERGATFFFTLRLPAEG